MSTKPELLIVTWLMTELYVEQTGRYRVCQRSICLAGSVSLFLVCVYSTAQEATGTLTSEVGS